MSKYTYYLRTEKARSYSGRIEVDGGTGLAKLSNSTAGGRPPAGERGWTKQVDWIYESETVTQFSCGPKPSKCWWEVTFDPSDDDFDARVTGGWETG